MNNRKEIIYIISPGHSGSTLLGNILGSVKKAIHIGEFIAPLQRDIAIKCQSCNGTPCPIWGGVLYEDYVKKVYQSYINYLKPSFIQKIFNKHKNLYTPIFKEFKSLDLVIDSSKKIPWTRYNIEKFHEFDYKIIFLHRDLKAVWASNLRKYPERNSKDDLLRLGKSVEAIFSFQQEMDQLGYVIHYEELVNCPEEQLQNLSEFIGIDYDEQMLRYYDYPHHTLGSNRNTLLVNNEAKKNNLGHLQKMNLSDKKFYDDLESGFKLDDRWKTELTSGNLRLFDEILGEINNKLGYK